MTDENKKMKQYIQSIKRELNMPRSVKERVMSDLISSIEVRREAGQSDGQILAEMGTPKQAAAELNEQMKEYTYRKSPWRWVCLGIAALAGITLLFGGRIGLLTFMLNKTINNSVGIIGGADGPTSIFIATSPDAYLYEAGICIVLLVLGLVGYLALRHCKK